MSLAVQIGMTIFKGALAVTALGTAPSYRPFYNNNHTENPP